MLERITLQEARMRGEVYSLSDEGITAYIAQLAASENDIVDNFGHILSAIARASLRRYEGKMTANQWRWVQDAFARTGFKGL